jgi:DNA polymerase III alpha subunit
LKDTYGVILYQEQVLRIAHELAGLSLADADLLRRAMSHFDPGKQMQTLKEKFIAGAHERNSVPEKVADRVWEMMAAFAGYGFPKAHAASYAQVAWRSAWCKTHFTALFMAAVLANWGGYYRQSVYLTEARRLGLAVRPPHVNFARREFSLSYVDGDPVLYMGLDQVRDLTKQTQKRIMRLQPFSSLSDFLTRADPRPGEAENLVKVGALYGMGTIPRLLDQLSTGGWQRGQLQLFEMPDTILSPGSDELPMEDDWSIEERVAAQESILGVGIDAHPLELVRERIRRAGAITTLRAIEMIGKQVRVAGMRQTWRRGSTNTGERLYVMSLEDLEGMLNVVIFSDAYQRVRREISGSGPYVVEGQMELDQRVGEPYLRLEKIWRL